MTSYECCKVLKSQFWFYNTKCKNPDQALRQLAGQHYFVQPVFRPFLLKQVDVCMSYCKAHIFIQLDKLLFFNEKLVLLST